MPTVVALVVLVASIRVLPLGPRRRSESLDTVGAALLTVAIFVLLVGFRDLHAVWMCVGVTLLALFVVHLTRSASPLIPLHLLQPRHRSTALVAIMAASASMACCYFILALYFQRVRGFSPAQTSLALLPTALAILLAVMLARHLVHVASSRTITATGLALAAAGLFIMAGLRDNASYDAALMLGLFLFPFGAGLAFSGATPWAASDVAQREAGVVGGMTNTALELGPPFGLALLVPLATSYATSLRGPSLELATARGNGVAFTAAALVLLVLSSVAFFDRASGAPVPGRRCCNSHVPTQSRTRQGRKYMG
jgi:predicted MFS family arabinose efflux permease